MQRLGRKGHPVYRVVVQDSRQAPTSGKKVALLGNYDPHTKTTNLDKEKAEFYLNNGAQPSDRVINLFTTEKIKLPKWVEKPVKHKREIRNPEKLRRNRPAGEPAPAPAEEKPAEEGETSAENTTEAETPDTTVAESSETTSETSEQPAEESAGATEETKPEEPVEQPAAPEAPAEPEKPKEESPAEPTDEASSEKTA